MNTCRMKSNYLPHKDPHSSINNNKNNGDHKKNAHFMVKAPSSSTATTTATSSTAEIETETETILASKEKSVSPLFFFSNMKSLFSSFNSSNDGENENGNHTEHDNNFTPSCEHSKKTEANISSNQELMNHNLAPTMAATITPPNNESTTTTSVATNINMKKMKNGSMTMVDSDVDEEDDLPLSQLLKSIDNKNSNTIQKRKSAISSVTNESNHSKDDNVVEVGIQFKPIQKNGIDKSNENKPNERFECQDKKQPTHGVHKTICNGNKIDSSIESEVRIQPQQIPHEMNNENLRKENDEMTKSSRKRKKHEFCFLQVGTRLQNKRKLVIPGESLEKLGYCDTRKERIVSQNDGENASKKEFQVSDCSDNSNISNGEDARIEQQSPNESESLVNGSDHQTPPKAIIRYEPLGLNEDDLCINDKILSEMFTWTTFKHLNRFEQEILWLIELGFSMIDKANLIQDESHGSDIQKYELSFRYIQQFISNELRSNFFDNFQVMDEITQQRKAVNITSNSMLIRYGVRHKNPKIKVEFMSKQREAKSYIVSKIQKRNYARCLSTLYTNKRISLLCKEVPVHDKFHSPEINKRWFQLHNEDDNKNTCNEAKLKPGEMVYLFEDPLSNFGNLGHNDFDFQRLICYHGEILAHKKHSDYVTYSVLLRDSSSIEHGVVAQSIFCTNRIISLRALCLKK